MQSPAEHPVQAEQQAHQPQPPHPEFVSVLDLAELLRISKQAVYRLIHKRDVPARVAGRNIDVYGDYYAALAAEINSRRPVNVADFTQQWLSARTPAPEAVSS